MGRAGALDWLAPRGPEPVLEVTADDPGTRAALREGLLVEIWPGVLRARDLPVAPHDRTRAIGRAVPRDGVACRQTAVWIHTGQFRPEALDVVVPGRRRSSAHTRVHAEALPPGAVVLVGAVRVTSRARTAVDVARWAEAEVAHDWLRALSREGLREADLETALEQARGLPGIARARWLLAAR
jgi:hypothetical protein